MLGKVIGAWPDRQQRARPAGRRAVSRAAVSASRPNAAARARARVSRFSRVERSHRLATDATRRGLIEPGRTDRPPTRPAALASVSPPRRARRRRAFGRGTRAMRSRLNSARGAGLAGSRCAIGDIDRGGAVLASGLLSCRRSAAGGVLTSARSGPRVSSSRSAAARSRLAVVPPRYLLIRGAAPSGSDS